METILKDGMCRCCASEGTFKDFTASYQWMGVEEVYSDMLKDCFDITLSTSLHGNSNGGICEVCVTQLRNAFNFKKQVQHTEEKFKKMQEIVFKPETIKIEMGHDDSEPNSDNMDDDFSGAEYDVPIKYETADDTKPKKRAAKASTSKKKPKTELGETSAKRRTGARKKRKRTLVEESECEPSENVNDIVYRERHLSEMQKQWHNLNVLLTHSNITPFKDRNDAGYICAYCFKAYPDPGELRRHTHCDHGKEKPSYKAGSGMSSFVAFLDIVDLKCTLCDSSMESIGALTNHLVIVHDKKYYLDVTDYFQPFKLTNEQQINCCLCDEIFHNMKLLMQHMNEHYRNFICTICGAGFVNSFRLNRHETTHVKKKSSFPCRHCGQVFAAESKKKAHVNTEHKGIAGDSVCQICKARFKNYYQKTRHMSQVHNVEGIKCDVCDKKFNLKSNLVLHMRSVHLKERPYACSVCSMGFFIKRHMLGHYLATHTNERKFKCDVCSKAYATQNSRRKHMKKNHGITKAPAVASIAK